MHGRSRRGLVIALIVGLNLNRRHLDASQWAMIGGRIKQVFEAEARERQGTRTDLRANLPEGEEGRARDKAAAAVDVSPRSVESATKVQTNGVSKLAAMVETGEVSVSAAASVADLPKSEQEAGVTGPAQY
jgi:hypothetical protein